jgi:hypothetical protein
LTEIRYWQSVLIHLYLFASTTTLSTQHICLSIYEQFSKRDYIIFERSDKAGKQVIVLVYETVIQETFYDVKGSNQKPYIDGWFMVLNTTFNNISVISSPDFFCPRGRGIFNFLRSVVYNFLPVRPFSFAVVKYVLFYLRTATI